MNEEIRTTVRQIVANQITIGEDQIRDGLSLRDNGTDSLDDIEIVMKIEEVFDIDIADDDVESIKVIRDIYGLVERKSKSAPCGAGSALDSSA